MTPPARGTIRICSSALVPLVLLALLWSDNPAAARLQAARHVSKNTHGVAPAIPQEFPDGVHLTMPKPKPVAPPKPQPKATPRIAWPAIPQEQLSSFGARSVFDGLGAWVDVYDYPMLSLKKTMRVLQKAGVQTLYMETGMTGTPQAVVPASIPWLVAAHNEGMKVVAWYLPDYSNVRFDAQRSIAIAHFSYAGIHFDGLGIDIEYKGALGNNRIWNQHVIAHMSRVRSALGPNYPLAAIPPPPLQMRLAPNTWWGFPWTQLGKLSSDIMLMSYWSFRSGCPQIPLNCPYEFTKDNVEITRAMTGGRVPIHVIGGVADSINWRQLNQFVQGAIDAHADGASIYDIGTTRPEWWRSLSRLRALG
ncbi:MAG TPA: hypothetical protein VKV69_05835 [Actinomycetota bacterium]|nr:hypothetical protein [Actinomycetota bacterium]